MSELFRIESITQVHDLVGFPKPKHPLVSVIRFTGEAMKPDLREVRFVNDLYQVMLKDGFSGTLGYGRNSYDFHEGTLVFTSPGQVLSFDGDKEHHAAEGWMLLFHPDLIRQSPLGSSIDQYTFFSYEVHEALHLSDDEKASVYDIVGKIEREYNQNIDQHSQKLIVSNIELLLNYCTRYYDRQFYTRSNLSKDAVSNFEKLLRDYYHSDQPLFSGVPTVQYCGEQLNMSPNYLSDLLKKETGRNAQEHIHGFLINKAKNKLLASQEPISQIAYDLGFEYPQHFSKIFRSKTGMSPTQYRNLS